MRQGGHLGERHRSSALALVFPPGKRARNFAALWSRCAVEVDQLLPRDARQAGFSLAATLVSRTGAFYNPLITPPAAVVSFTRGPGTQGPINADALSANGCLKIDPYFRISQEH